MWLGSERRPSDIPDAEIERVRRMVESGLLVTPYPYVQVGQPVLIERGPLSGVEGILVEVKGKVALGCVRQPSAAFRVRRSRP